MNASETGDLDDFPAGGGSTKRKAPKKAVKQDAPPDPPPRRNRKLGAGAGKIPPYSFSTRIPVELAAHLKRYASDMSEPQAAVVEQALVDFFEAEGFPYTGPRT